MAFGWRPENVHGAPIPMYYDYEQFELAVNPITRQNYPIYYLGKRFNDSLEMHRTFSNKAKMEGPDNSAAYHFKFPPH